MTVGQVEVSADAGKTRHPAQITSRNIPYGWVLWESSVPVTGPTTGLLIRATDSAGLVQPQIVRWKLKGYLYNAWHPVPLKVTS